MWRPDLLLVLCLAAGGLAGCDDEPDPDDGHGHDHGHAGPVEPVFDPVHAVGPAGEGLRTTGQEFQVETVFEAGAVVLHLYDRESRPVDPTGVRGTIRLVPRDRDLAIVERDLVVHADHLEAEFDLTGLYEGHVRFEIHLEGLPGQIERSLDFARVYRRPPERAGHRADPDEGDEHGHEGHGHEGHGH